jgi:hypothetical protein
MKAIVALISVAVFLQFSSGSAFAQSLDVATGKDFLGLGLGVGLSLSADRARGKRRVESASVVNGVVRVSEERNAQARVVLESHYFFEPEGTFFLGKVPAKSWGHGPFLAVQPGDNEIVSAIGFGWMFGFKRANASRNAESWNFGFGVMVDPNARVLGDGLEVDKPLPAGEMDVRYKTEAESSLLIIFSFSF